METKMIQHPYFMNNEQKDSPIYDEFMRFTYDPNYQVSGINLSIYNCLKETNDVENPNTALMLYRHKDSKSQQLDFGVLVTVDEQLDVRWRKENFLDLIKGTDIGKIFERDNPNFLTEYNLEGTLYNGEIELRKHRINQHPTPFQIRYPSIKSFKNVVSSYQRFQRHLKRPIKIRGTAKGHGCNYSFHYDHGKLYFQSKDELITYRDRFNIGDLLTIPTWRLYFRNWAYQVKSQYGLTDHFVISFELLGGDVQKTASTQGLPLFMSVFDIANVVIDETIDQNHPDYVNCISTPSPVRLQHIPLDGPLVTHKSLNIYDVREFGIWEEEIDVNDLEGCTERLAELVRQVEEHCPIAAYFGVESDKGEGLVFTCPDTINHLYGYNSGLDFKVKGERHKVANTKKRVPFKTEQVNGLDELLDYVMPLGRLEQGVSETGEISKTNQGFFLSWLTRDILKEEMDTIEKSGIDIEIVTKGIGKRGVEWYMEKRGIPPKKK